MDNETLKAKLALAFLLLILLALIVRAAEASNECLNEWYWPKCDDGNPLNGYWWRDFGVWVPGLITTETWFTPAPDYFWGNAVFYAPGIMEATATWRGYDLDDYIGGVALMSPADIGSEIWIRPTFITESGNYYTGSWEGPFLVVDCARKGDMWPVVINRFEAIEVDFKTAQRWRMVYGTISNWSVRNWRLPFTQVSKVDPSLLIDNDNLEWEDLLNWDNAHLSFSEWFRETVSFTDHHEPRVHFRPPNEWRINGEWMTFNNYNDLEYERLKQNGRRKCLTCFHRNR